jgi:acyl-CoA dehydrogenase
MSAPSSSPAAAAQEATQAAEAAVEAIAGAAGQEATFSLALSQDQKDIREWVHGFAADVVRPAAHEWDEKEQTPWPIIQEAAKIGLYGYEGMAQFFADPTGLTLPLVQEELFWGDAGIGMSIMGTSLAVAAIFGQGTGEQIGEWIPRCFGTLDEIKVAAFCASEPNAGSDVSGVRASAKFDEAANEWVINGQKAWATNGGIADVHVVIASVDRELGARGHAAFVVPMSEAKGISQGTKVSKHGLRASHTADVFLDDCRVPSGHVLGGKDKLDERLARVREGKRSKSQAAMQTFESSRPTVAAQALGIARAAYEYALEYAKEREQFGRKIIENQAIAFTLARMKTEIDATRLLVWRASWMGRNRVPFEDAEGSMSKLKAGEVSVWVTERAMQILGGNAEIQQRVIARAISGMHIK